MRGSVRSYDRRTDLGQCAVCGVAGPVAGDLSVRVIGSVNGSVVTSVRHLFGTLPKLHPWPSHGSHVPKTAAAVSSTSATVTPQLVKVYIAADGQKLQRGQSLKLEFCLHDWARPQKEKEQRYCRYLNPRSPQICHFTVLLALRFTPCPISKVKIREIAALCKRGLNWPLILPIMKYFLVWSHWVWKHGYQA